MGYICHKFPANIFKAPYFCKVAHDNKNACVFAVSVTEYCKTCIKKTLSCMGMADDIDFSRLYGPDNFLECPV